MKTLCTIIVVFLIADLTFALGNGNSGEALYAEDNGIVIETNFFWDTIQTRAASEVGLASTNKFSYACAGSDNLGSGDFISVSLKGCDEPECLLKINTSYNGVLRFATRKNESELRINVTVTPEEPNPTDPSWLIGRSFYPGRNYTPNVEYDFTFPVKFFPGQHNVKSGIYKVELKLFSPNHGGIVLCRILKINLDAVTNDGTSIGAPCADENEPCHFKHSLCLSNNDSSGDGSKNKTCQCDWAAFYENGRGCQKKIETSCQTSSDCIENAGCVTTSGPNYGLCECNEGFFHPPDDLSHCKSSGSSLGYSVFLLLALVMAMVSQSNELF